MSKLLLAAAAVAVSATAGLAADLPGKKAVAAPVIVSPWDFAIGAALRSDYIFRGISQSDRAPGVTAYGELRYNMNDWLQAYAGISGSSVKLPTRPSMELDIYGGIRPTFGALALDFGAMAYIYPREQQLVTAGPVFWTPRNTDFYELYGKASYTFSPMFTAGANLYWSPSWLGTGASGAYASVTGKLSLPYNFAASAEFGRYFLGKTDLYLGALNLPDYNYWNAGLSYTYKFATLDLRYHDTNLSKTQCFAATSDPRGIANGSFSSRWCGAAFIASLSFDLTSKDLK